MIGKKAQNSFFCNWILYNIMEIKTFDLLLLFILAITVALIIGFNVIYIVDKKLNNIKINIPPCPKPNVYLKMDGNNISQIGFGDNYKDSNYMDSNYVDSNYVDSNYKDSNYKDSKKNEFFDTIDRNIYLSQGYNDESCQRKVSINNFDRLVCTKNNRYDMNNNITTEYIAADGSILNQNVDFYVPRVYMDTGVSSSYIDMTLDQHADVDQIGSMPINDYLGEPEPVILK